MKGGIGISGVDREPEEFCLMFLSREIDLTRLPDLPRISYKINFQIRNKSKGGEICSKRTFLLPTLRSC